MPAPRKIRRDVVLDRDAASSLIRGIAEGLRGGELVLHGQDGRIMMTPGDEVQIRMTCCESRRRLNMRLSWERLRSLRDRPAPTLAAPTAAPKPAAPKPAAVKPAPPARPPSPKNRRRR